MASTIAAVTTSGGGVITTADSSGNLSLLSGATTVVAVTATGVDVTGTLAATGASTFTGTGKFATTIGVGNATPSASGSGITFPATQSASSDANTLDDYEEGTFTPSCPTALTTADGTYIKIGNIVFFSIRVAITANVSVVAFTLSLPFAANSSQAMRAGGWFSYTNGGSATAANTTWMVDAGAAVISAYTTGGGNRACSDFNAALWIGGQYRTA